LPQLITDFVENAIESVGVGVVEKMDIHRVAH